MIEKPAKQPNASTPAPSTPMFSTEVNAIQITQTLGNKKKGKGKNKKLRNQQENTKTATIKNNNKGKRKDKYTFLLCGGDHFTKVTLHEYTFLLWWLQNGSRINGTDEGSLVWNSIQTIGKNHH